MPGRLLPNNKYRSLLYAYLSPQLVRFLVSQKWTMCKCRMHPCLYTYTVSCTQTASLILLAFQLRNDQMAIKNKTFQSQSIIFNINQMAHRYNKWTDYEDNILTQLVQKYGIGHWSTIAKEMKTHYDISNRNGKQCRERWFNQLDRSNVNRKWTEKEDLSLIQFQAILGTRWIQITMNFPGRSDNNVKNHFYSIVRKSIRKMCRYVNIKTSSMKVYSIKPSTLSTIFVEAASEATEVQSHQPQGSANGLFSRFTKQDYCQITQIIQYFIFDNSPTFEPGLPTQEQVLAALNKLMEINNFFQKDLSEDVNYHESYSSSEKKDSPQSKNESSERECQEMELEEKQQIKMCQQYPIIEKVYIEEEGNNCGIFSIKPQNKEGPLVKDISTLPYTSITLNEHKDVLEPDAKIPNFELLRGASEISMGSNFPEINWNDYNEYEQSQMRFYVTPRRSGTENLFNKYLQ